ncbi:hypothetical protein BGX23_011633 [Mortierella sp. AD031]|nr:hypothetical protein BGX23_011633 [Mortierella sp. AD031]
MITTGQKSILNCEPALSIVAATGMVDSISGTKKRGKAGNLYYATPEMLVPELDYILFYHLDKASLLDLMCTDRAHILLFSGKPPPTQRHQPMRDFRHHRSRSSFVPGIVSDHGSIAYEPAQPSCAEPLSQTALDPLPLRDLELLGLTIKDGASALNISITLAGIPDLQRLTIRYTVNGTIPNVAALLFIPFRHLRTKSSWNRLWLLEIDTDMALDGSGFGPVKLELPSPVSRRTAPLPLVMDLRTLEWDERVINPKFMETLALYPGLETLLVCYPYLAEKVDGSRIDRACSRLHNLFFTGGDDSDGSWIIDALDVLPKDQATSLEYDAPRRRLLLDIVRQVVERYARTLGEIVILSSISIRAMQLILTTCGVLERFEMSCSTITLKDAVELPWARSRMTRLCLDVGIVGDAQQEYFSLIGMFLSPIPNAKRYAIFGD